MNSVGLNKATCECEHECKLEPVEAEDTEFSRVFAGECANCGANHYYKVTDLKKEEVAEAAAKVAEAEAKKAEAAEKRASVTAGSLRSNR